MDPADHGVIGRDDRSCRQQSAGDSRLEVSTNVDVESWMVGGLIAVKLVVNRQRG